MQSICYGNHELDGSWYVTKKKRWFMVKHKYPFFFFFLKESIFNSCDILLYKPLAIVKIKKCLNCKTYRSPMSTEGDCANMEEVEIKKWKETMNKKSLKERTTSMANSLTIKAGIVSNITNHSSKVSLPIVFSSSLFSLIELSLSTHIYNEINLYSYVHK